MAARPKETSRAYGGSSNESPPHSTIQSTRQRDPLHWAAVHGYEANVKALLDHGANPDATNKDGSNPQAAAERNRHWNVAQMLARNPPLRSPNTEQKRPSRQTTPSGTSACGSESPIAHCS
ncbi:MAG: ankyrin repeat domain-containing protein [Acidimicrobiia bacterium]|nr:ankyrin repeat domain-containing protein [Acidimicrobiia bacterium]